MRNAPHGAKGELVINFRGGPETFSALDIPKATQEGVVDIGMVFVGAVEPIVPGCFMESASIMLITLPIFMPVVKALGFNVVWFAVIYLINIETGLLTPPFGLNIFVMKAVAPPDTLVKEIYTAITPFVLINVAVMGVIMAFPQIAPCLSHLTRLW